MIIRFSTWHSIRRCNKLIPPNYFKSILEYIFAWKPHSKCRNKKVIFFLFVLFYFRILKLQFLGISYVLQCYQHNFELWQLELFRYGYPTITHTDELSFKCSLVSGTIFKISSSIGHVPSSTLRPYLYSASSQQSQTAIICICREKNLRNKYYLW